MLRLPILQVTRGLKCDGSATIDLTEKHAQEAPVSPMHQALAALLLTVLTAASAASEPATVDEAVERARAGIDFIDNEYLKARRAANPALVLLDVRSQLEYEAGHVPGARSVPRGVAEFVVTRTVRDANAEIITYCRTGTRAALATKALRELGYTNVRAHPGFETWRDAGEPTAAGKPESPDG